MAFGQKVTVEDLVALGLDPAQIKAIKDKIDGIDPTKLSKLDKVDGLETSLNDIKAGLADLTQKFSSVTPPAKGAKEEVTPTEEEPDFILDPAKATQQVVAKSMSPIVTTVAEMRASTNYDRFKMTNPKGFAKLEPKIKEIWDKQNLGNRQNPELIENIYKIVLADNIDQIMKEPETFFIETSRSSSTAPPDTTKKKAEEVLSKDELEAAKSWGLSPDEYLEEKNKGAVNYA